MNDREKIRSLHVGDKEPDIKSWKGNTVTAVKEPKQKTSLLFKIMKSLK